MARLARQAIVVSFSRFANYALMLVSPMVLVRLLSVDDFGRYREFLLYGSVLTSFASFSITTSLLYFVPSNSERAWQFVRQTTILTAITSAIVIVVLIVLDLVMSRAVVGEFLVPLTLYILFSANVDFWEFLWLAKNRSMSVFAYSTGRLLARMAVVIAAAALSKNVGTIITALLVLEGVRFALSILAWFTAEKVDQPSDKEDWRRLLHFCIPNGASMMLSVVNRYVANIFVVKVLGPAALAQYTIATYIDPIIGTLRNSLSDAMLPQMVARGADSYEDSIALWQRGVIICAILLFPIGMLCARYADTLITLAFPKYQEAVPVFRVFLLVLFRECFDFAMALKAINKTRYFLYADVAAIVLNLVAVIVLLPRVGLIGAVAAYVISSYVEGIVLGWWTSRLYKVPIRKFVPWSDIAKVGIAAVLSLLVTWGSFLTDWSKLGGVAIGGLLYLASFAALLRILKVREALFLIDLVINRLRATRTAVP